MFQRIFRKVRGRFSKNLCSSTQTQAFKAVNDLEELAQEEVPLAAFAAATGLDRCASYNRLVKPDGHVQEFTLQKSFRGSLARCTRSVTDPLNRRGSVASTGSDGDCFPSPGGGPGGPHRGVPPLAAGPGLQPLENRTGSNGLLSPSLPALSGSSQASPKYRSSPFPESPESRKESSPDADQRLILSPSISESSESRPRFPSH
jgi:hypothetical protein